MATRLFLQEGYYQWLREGIAQGEESVLSQFLLDGAEYARGFIRAAVPEADREDVEAEVQLSLLRGLPDFLRRSEEQTDFARQAWVKTLVEHAIYDYHDSIPFSPSLRTQTKLREQGAQLPSVLSLEDYRQSGGDLPAPDTQEDTFVGVDTGELAGSILRTVGSLRISPAEMLTFLYHNVVFFLEGDSAKKGKPADTLRRLSGHTLGQLRDALPAALRRVCGFPPPPDSLIPLDQALEGHRDELFQLPPEKVSYLSSYVKKRLRTRR